MESSGGGGFGDPLERDPARVAADVAEGYVTPAAAEAIYGVVLARRRRRCGGDARAARRAARRRARACASPPAADLDAERGRAIRLDATTARAPRRRRRAPSSSW